MLERFVIFEEYNLVLFLKNLAFIDLRLYASINIMDPVKLNKPFISEELARDLTSKLYGFKVISIKEMVSYDDKNFHIKVSDEYSNPYIEEICSDGYTLKITNTQKTSLPAHFGDANHVGKGHCGVHLLTFIPGQCIGTLKQDENLLLQWGKLLAQFQIAMMDFSNDVLDKKTIFWDLSHVPEIVRFMDGLEREKANLVHEVLLRHPRELNGPVEFVKRGYIHADFNDNNILSRNSPTGYLVDGILDLEDLHFGPLVWDIGLMMAYASLNCVDIDPVDGMGYALKGYLQLRDMSNTELSYIKICIVSRLVQSLVMGSYYYRKNPGNEYLLESAKNGWSRLAQIWRIPDEHLLEKWKSLRPNI